MPSRRHVVALLCGALLTTVPVQGAALANEEIRSRLFDRLKSARTEAEGREAENNIWLYWTETAPSAAMAADVKAAMDARSGYDYDKALAILDRVIEDAPGYAEAWNQRAFVLFLKEDFDASLHDLDRALEHEPLHFGALAGKGIILMRQGRAELGQKALREAVAIHPWLRERSMIIPVPGESLPNLGSGVSGKDI